MIRVRFLAEALMAAQRRRTMCIPHRERKPETEEERPADGDKPAREKIEGQ